MESFCLCHNVYSTERWWGFRLFFFIPYHENGKGRRILVSLSPCAAGVNTIIHWTTVGSFHLYILILVGLWLYWIQEGIHWIPRKTNKNYNWTVRVNTAKKHSNNKNLFSFSIISSTFRFRVVQFTCMRHPLILLDYFFNSLVVQYARCSNLLIVQNEIMYT